MQDLWPEIPMRHQLYVMRTHQFCCMRTTNCFLSDLSAAVDVYSEWVDAADAVAQQANRTSVQPLSSNKMSRVAKPVEDDDEDRRYGGEGIVEDEEEYD